MKSPDKPLDPNDPEVYTDPEKVRLLDPTDQMVATINMALTGQIVNGDPVLTLEAIMEAAGYDMTLDGHLSAEEQKFLEDFKRKLEDKDFKETAAELLKIIAETTEKDVASIIETASAPNLTGEFGTAARNKAIRKILQLISDPD